MTKTELICEYFKLRHQFDSHTNCKIICPELPSVTDINDFSKRFTVQDLQDKIAAVKSALKYCCPMCEEAHNPESEKQGEQKLTELRTCQCNVDGILTETEGIRRIAKERNRQIEEEGYDEEHDSCLSVDSFIACAISYAMRELHKQEAEKWWTWDRNYFKPKDRLRNLERAGALIAAAIDKMIKEESENNPSQENETL